MIGAFVLGLFLAQSADDPISALELEMEQRVWTPPETNVPAELVEAAQVLFAHGLADPTGGELRHVTIETVSTEWGRKLRADSAGWVLQERAAGRQLVVTFDGLIHVPIEVGEPVSLDELLIDERPAFNMHEWPTAAGSDPRTGFLAAALFLRSGDTSGAERLYEYQAGGYRDGSKFGFLMATQYSTARIGRAVGAHRYGGDALVLRDTSSLVRNMDALKALCGSAGLLGPGDEGIDPLPLLKDVERLQADARRRLGRSRPPFEFSLLDDLPTADRIALLIRYLDDVGATMWPMEINHISRAFVDIGEASVVPLIEVLETDARLTRTVFSTRLIVIGGDFGRNLTLHTVKEAAWSIVGVILDRPAIKYGPDRTNWIDDVRAYWRDNSALSPIERKYRALHDDKGTTEQWLRAAKGIVERTNIDRTYGGMQYTPIRPGEPLPPMKGEALRDRRDPSVSALIGQRVSEILSSAELLDDPNLIDLHDAFTLAKYLFVWDPWSSLDSMVELTQTAEDAKLYLYSRRSAAGYIVPSVSYATVARMRMGDSAAAAQYVEIVRRLVRMVGLSDMEPFFAPLIVFPDDPVLARFSEELFGATDSRLHPKNTRTGLAGWGFGNRMLANRACRTMFLGLLEDTSVVGEVWRVAGELKFDLGSNQGGAGYFPVDEKIVEQHDVLTGRVELRACDAVATNLSRLIGAPPFYPLWEIPARDAAIREIARFLEQNAHRIHEIVVRRFEPPEPDWMTSEPITCK